MAKPPDSDHSQDTDELLRSQQERFNKRREELTAELADLDARLARINRYFEEPEKPAPRKKAATTTSTTRASKGERQDQILAVLKETAGLTRADILEKLGAEQGTPLASQISQALTNMKSKGQLTLDDGKYTVTPSEPPAA